MLPNIYYAAISFNFLNFNDLINTLKNSRFMLFLPLIKLLFSGENAMKLVNFQPKNLRAEFNKYFFNNNNFFNNRFILINKKRFNIQYQCNNRNKRLRGDISAKRSINTNNKIIAFDFKL